MLDANDNNPVFYPREYEATIARATSVGTEVIFVRATDEDELDFGRVRYRITSGGSGQFAIDDVTGAIRLTSPLGSLVSQVVLQVSAVDGGDLASIIDVSVTVRVVDSLADLPQFTHNLYDFSIAENSAVNTPIGSVSAQSVAGA